MARIYWKKKKKVKWHGKRKDIVTSPGEYLPYIKLADGSHGGTYREYRYRHPCDTYKQMLKGARKKLTTRQIIMLSDIDKEARRWWNKRHPDKKCV